MANNNLDAASSRSEEDNMTKCPYCQKRVNPISFFSYSRWSPYRCPACGKTSRFSLFLLAIVGGTGAVVAEIVGGLFHFHLIGTIAFGIAIILGMMCFLKLKPMLSVSKQTEDIEHVPPEGRPKPGATAGGRSH